MKATQKIDTGLVALFLLLAYLLFGCGDDAPTAPADAPALAPGDSLVTVYEGDTVVWALSDSSYRFTQTHPTHGRVSWEQGTWWLQDGWDGPAVVFAREEGGYLRRLEPRTWGDLPPHTRPYEIVILRGWVGLRATGGLPIYYEVRR